MSKFAADIEILPSVLDRLVGEGPIQDLEELKASVRDDLDALLNTRREVHRAMPTDLSHSLLNYGIPDFTSFNVKNSDDRNRIAKEIEQTVREFEPRLQNVKVSLEPPSKESHGALHFSIEGKLRVQPDERVIFNAVLEVNTQKLKLEGDQ
jgi:type VI secretion system protein ImpF